MNETKRSASERIQDLERATMSLYQTVDNMARDLMTVKDAIKLLGNKVDAIVKAAERGSVNDNSVADIMIENNVSELKSKVDDLITKGILTYEATVTPESYVVGREIDETGKVVNPRLQFAMSALDPEIREKIVGAMAGNVLELATGKLKLEVLETYTIQVPSPAQEEAALVADIAASEALTPEATQEAAGS